jgi:hypothetical protein
MQSQFSPNAGAKREKMKEKHILGQAWYTFIYSAVEVPQSGYNLANNLNSFFQGSSKKMRTIEYRKILPFVDHK